MLQRLDPSSRQASHQVETSEAFIHQFSDLPRKTVQILKQWVSRLPFPDIFLICSQTIGKGGQL
jgi:hypothetical protein